MANERDLAEQLLRLARDDEAAARAMLDVGAVTDAIVGFHAQQAVEKALKAVPDSAQGSHPAEDTTGRRTVCTRPDNPCEMRPRGLEPPRGKSPTRPSTLRVYQFRHGREGRESIGARP
jgi:HEPN domain